MIVPLLMSKSKCDKWYCRHHNHHHDVAIADVAEAASEIEPCPPLMRSRHKLRLAHWHCPLTKWRIREGIGPCLREYATVPYCTHHY